MSTGSEFQTEGKQRQCMAKEGTLHKPVSEARNLDREEILCEIKRLEKRCRATFGLQLQLQLQSYTLQHKFSEESCYLL